MQDLHYVQLRIIEELLFKKEATFTELNALKLSNDHFTFHLKQLIRKELVVKNGDLYTLTARGLEVGGRLDLDNSMLFTQAKISVSVGIMRETLDGIEFLLSKRKRNPSNGKIAWHTAKVRIGDLLVDTAKKCVLDETGLQGEPLFMGTTHVIREENQVLEADVVVIDFLVVNPTGELIIETPDQTNFWISYKEAIKLDNTLVGMKEKLEAFKNRQITFNEYIN